MRQIETDPTIIDDDSTDVMIPIAPVTNAMTKMLNQYVYDVLDTFEAMIVRRIIVGLLSLMSVSVVCLVVGAFTKEWTPLFVSFTCMLVYGFGTYPIIEVAKKRPDPATVGHIRAPSNKASMN